MILSRAKNGRISGGGKPSVQSSIIDFQPAKDNFSKHDRTLFLLSEGITLKKVASILGENYYTIAKRGKRAAQKGILTQDPISFPALYSPGPQYEKWKLTSTGQIFSASEKKPEITYPHRFQVQFYIGSENYRNSLGLEALRRRYHFARFEERGNLSAIWETRILTISVKRFARGSPGDKIKEGLRIAQEYADAHNAAGARLRFRRLLGRIEWIVSDKPLSDYLVGLLGLKPGEMVQINEAQWKLDLSHPENIEINALHPFPEHKPTETVDTLQFLLDRAKLLETVRIMKEQLEQQGELNVGLVQRQHVLEARIKTLEGKHG
jgi:hypothetical protein